MTHAKLRFVAAQFALGLAHTGDLVDAAHAALDEGIYADGLAVIATSPGITSSDATPLFASALVDLGHAFPSRDDALRHLQACHFGRIAGGTVSPRNGLGLYYAEVHQPLQWGNDTRLDAWGRSSVRALISHWYDLEYLVAVHEDGRDTARLDQAVEEWQGRGVQLAREWCLEHRIPTPEPRWRSETVLALAAGIYAEGAFDRLPILADALEEAGCDNTDILAHCRGPGPHVRGCWVVDLILGKS